jgi:hypothetical protein
MDAALKLSDSEISRTFADPLTAERYPPVLTLGQAAALLQVPAETIRDWRKRGLLDGSCRKIGKHLRFYRDRLLKHAFNDGFHS